MKVLSHVIKSYPFLLFNVCLYEGVNGNTSNGYCSSNPSLPRDFVPCQILQPLEYKKTRGWLINLESRSEVFLIWKFRVSWRHKSFWGEEWTNTEYNNGESNDKNSLQHISNCMCKRRNPFQGVGSKLQLEAKELKEPEKCKFNTLLVWFTLCHYQTCAFGV